MVTLTAENELDPTVSLKLDYLDFPGDQTSGVIESSTGVDLESFTGFALNNQGSQENTLTIDDGEFEGKPDYFVPLSANIRSYTFEETVLG